MSALGSLVVKLALEYAQYTQGLNKADQEALKFAQKQQKHFDDAKKKAGEWASGTGAAVAGAVTAFVSVGAAVEGMRRAIDRMDSIDNLSQRLGIAKSELQELAHVAKMSDTDLGGAANGFKKLNVAIAEAAGGSDQASEKFSKIGVSVTDANGKIRGSSAIMADIADKFAGMEDGAQKTALAISLFGKSGTDLIPMLNGGGKAMREAAEEARKFGLVVTDEAIAAAAQFNDNIDKLGSLVEGTFNQFAAASLPVLSSFSEAMVESASGTDSLNAASQRLNKNGTIREWAEGAAKFLGFVVDAGQGVYRTFEIIGKTMGAGAAQIAALLSGDLATARQIGIEWAADIDSVLNREMFSTRLNAKLKELQGALSDSKSNGTKDAPAISKATEKKISDYQKMVNVLKEKTAAEEAEVLAGRELSAVESMRAKLNADLAAGTVKMTKAEQDHVAVLMDSLDVAQQQNAARAEKEKKDKEAIKSQAEATEATKDELAALEAELAAQAALPSALAASTLAKMEAALATIRLTAGTEAESAAVREQIRLLEEQIGAQKKIVALQGSKEASEAAAESAKQAAKEWEKASGQIEAALTDALMEGFENGKSIAQSFRDTLVNMFKTLVLRPIVQAIVQPVANGFMNMLGGSGGGSGGGSNVGALSNLAGTIGNVYQGFSAGGFSGGMSALNTAYQGSALGSLGGSVGGMVSGFGNMIGSSSISAFGAGMGMSGSAAGTAAGAYSSAGMGSTGSALTAGSAAGAAVGIAGGIAGGVYGGRMVSNGYAVGGGSGNSAVNTGTAIGAAIGSIIPVIGTALGALIGGLLGGAVNRLFGHRPKEEKAFGIAGVFSASEDSGSFGHGRTYSDWTQKGGTFRSDKSGTTETDMDDATEGEYAKGFRLLQTTTKGFAEALGVSSATIAGYSKNIKVELTKDAAENQKRIAAMFVGIADDLATRVAPNIAEFSREGETASVTLERLVNVTRLVDGVMDVFGRDAADAFGLTGLAAADAKQRLIDLSGGVDAFVAQSDFFAQNFLTDAERMAPVIKAVQDRMAALGHAGVQTKDQFAALVKGINLGDAAGAQLHANLMALAPAFVQVANYTAQLAAVGAEAGESLDVLMKRRELEIEILRLTGDEAGALAATRALELADMTASLRPLKARIWALQDEAKANEAAETASRELAEERARAAAAAAEERERADRAAAELFSSRQQMQIALMRAAGNATGALALERAIELEATDASLRGLKARIWALTDSAAAEEKAAAVLSSRQQMQIALMRANGNALGALTLERSIELAATDESLRAMKLRIWALQDAAIAEEKAASLNQSRQQMQIALMKASGDAAGALALERTLELAATDESLRAMKLRIWALEDSAEAETALANRRQELDSKVEDARGRLQSAYEKESGALQGVIDKFGSFAKSLRAFRDQLLTGNLSTLSPEQKYNETKARFDRTYALALAGDPQAAADLEGVSREFLESSKEYFASSEQYANDFDKVRDALSTAADAADSQASIAGEQLALLNASVVGLLTINESVISVQQAIADLAAATLARASVPVTVPPTPSTPAQPPAPVTPSPAPSTPVPAPIPATDPIVAPAPAPQPPAASPTPAAPAPAGVTETQRFINSLYQSYLGRDAEGAGLSFWSERIDSGAATRAQVEAAILGSEEFRAAMGVGGNVGDLAGGSVQQPPAPAAPAATETQRYINSLYRDYLGRDSDSAGLSFWSERIDSGAATKAQVRAAILESEEFRAAMGVGSALDDLTNSPLTPAPAADQAPAPAAPAPAPVPELTETRRFINALYSDYLGRAPDEAGAAFWDQMLTEGKATRADVRAAVLGSEEFKGVQRFAKGGAFTNGVVAKPTAFEIGEMGEAGPEAILPLARTSGGLGVRAALPARDDSALIAKMDAVLAELRAANLQRGAASVEQIDRLADLEKTMAAVQRQLARA